MYFLLFLSSYKWMRLTFIARSSFPILAPLYMDVVLFIMLLVCLILCCSGILLWFWIVTSSLFVLLPFVSLSPSFWSLKKGVLTFFHMYLRFGVSPSWWDSSGITSYPFFVFYPNSFYYTFSSPFPWGCLDCKYSWLHSWKGVACYGCWLPHHSPHYISAQLWPLHHMDGLDVWHTSRPQGGRRQGNVMDCWLSLFELLKYGSFHVKHKCVLYFSGVASQGGFMLERQGRRLKVELPCLWFYC